MYSLLYRIKKDCSKCRETKPVIKFYRRKRARTRKHGKRYFLDSWCKDCVNKRNRRWTYEHSEARIKHQRDYYRKNKDRINTQQRELLKQLRVEFVESYGGKCTCCGETEKKFLTIEHINGLGGDERKRMSSYRLLVKLKRLGWPKENHTVLCFNCNLSKGFFGLCPHKEVINA